jgi:hypothetical protein
MVHSVKRDLLNVFKKVEACQLDQKAAHILDDLVWQVLQGINTPEFHRKSH